MAKFGDLIDHKVPVLIEFYEIGPKSSSSDSDLKTVAEHFKKKAKIVRVDIDKNIQLSEALKIQQIPTWILYKNGEMVWRESGALKSQYLIEHIEKHL